MYVLLAWPLSLACHIVEVLATGHSTCYRSWMASSALILRNKSTKSALKGVPATLERPWNSLAACSCRKNELTGLYLLSLLRVLSCASAIACPCFISEGHFISEGVLHPCQCLSAMFVFIRIQRATSAFNCFAYYFFRAVSACTRSLLECR